MLNIHLEMILEIRAHARKVADDGKVVLTEHVRRTHTRELEKLRCVDCTGAGDHATGSDVSKTTMDANVDAHGAFADGLYSLTLGAGVSGLEKSGGRSAGQQKQRQHPW